MSRCGSNYFLGGAWLVKDYFKTLSASTVTRTAMIRRKSTQGRACFVERLVAYLIRVVGVWVREFKDQTVAGLNRVVRLESPLEVALVVHSEVGERNRIKLKILRCCESQPSVLTGCGEWHICYKH